MFSGIILICDWGKIFASLTPSLLLIDQLDLLSSSQDWDVKDEKGDLVPTWGLPSLTCCPERIIKIIGKSLIIEETTGESFPRSKSSDRSVHSCWDQGPWITLHRLTSVTVRNSPGLTERGRSSSELQTGVVTKDRWDKTGIYSLYLPLRKYRPTTTKQTTFFPITYVKTHMTTVQERRNRKSIDGPEHRLEV